MIHYIMYHLTVPFSVLKMNSYQKINETYDGSYFLLCALTVFFLA